MPALNEADRIDACLTSLQRQNVPLQVKVSDNSSHDGTVSLARAHAGHLALAVRTVDRLQAGAHLVATGTWVLSDADPQTDAFALLAGDDTWSDGFVEKALNTLERHPDIDVVWPTFEWEQDGVVVRRLRPSNRLSSPHAWRRHGAALLLPDRRELANIVYGVYRRAAFEHLLSAWERGGEEFAADYAAVWSVVGRYRVLGCPQAVARRHVRAGDDLLKRIGLSLDRDATAATKAKTYLVLNVRINRQIARALHRVDYRGWTPRPWQLQLLRCPQWVMAAGRYVRRGGASRP